MASQIPRHDDIRGEALSRNSVILHVGPHKSGSTAIQKGLFEQRDVLKACGVGYPLHGMSGFGHHTLVNHLRKWRIEFDVAAFREEVAATPQTILSSENFVHLGSDALERFQELLPEASIKVVYHLRRLTDLWPSHWQELLKHGHSMGFPEYLSYASFVRPSGRDMAIDQLQQLRTLMQVFGEDNLRIIGYDQLRQDGQDLLEQFLTQIVGLENQEGFRTEQINKSRDFVSIELLRMMNAIHKEKTGKLAHAHLRIALLERLAGKEPPFLTEFRDLVENCASKIEIDSESAVVRFLQNRVVARYQHCFVGNPVSVTEAYMSNVSRQVPNFEFPRTGFEHLQEALVQYYASLPESARDPG